MKGQRTCTAAILLMAIASPFRAKLLRSETPEKTAARFTLALSGGEENVYERDSFALLLTETNISNEPLRTSACLPFMLEPRIKIEVIYNGSPLDLDSAKPAAKMRKSIASGEARCPKYILHEAQSGGGPHGSFADILVISTLYDMSKPGRYEVTVCRESDPEHPQKSVTVRSNTIVLVVPEPDSI